MADSLQNHQARIKKQAPRGLDLIHNPPISSLNDSLQNHLARINKWTLGGSNSIHNPLVLSLIDPLQNHQARINKQTLGWPDPIHNPLVSSLTDPLKNHRARIIWESLKRTQSYTSSSYIRMSWCSTWLIRKKWIVSETCGKLRGCLDGEWVISYHLSLKTHHP